MILKPHQILKQLGFDVPEHGVEINPEDTFLICASLALVGRTMDEKRIATRDLANLNMELSKVARSRGLPTLQADDESLERLRTTVALAAFRLLKPVV